MLVPSIRRAILEEEPCKSIDEVRKQLKKIDRKWQSTIINHLEDEVAVFDDTNAVLIFGE